MAQYDGKILIDSAIDTSGFESDSKKLQSAVQNLTSKVDALGPSFKKALTGNNQASSAFRGRIQALQQQVEDLGPAFKKALAGNSSAVLAFKVEALELREALKELSPAFEKAFKSNQTNVAGFEAKASALQEKITALEANMKRLSLTKVPTQAYKDLSDEVEKAGQELEKLLNRREKIDTRGKLQGNTKYRGTTAYKNLVADLEIASKKFDELDAKKTQLEQSGRAYVSGAETDEYQAMSAELETAKAHLADMQSKVSAARSEFASMQQDIQGVSDRLAEMDTTVDAAAQSVQRLRSGWASLGSRIVSVLKGIPGAVGSIFSSVTSIVKKAFNTIVTAAKKVVSMVASAFKKVGSTVTKIAKTIGKKLTSAFKTAASAAKKLFTGNKDLGSSVAGISRALKKLIPAMLAARGVMGILRKAVNAFMDANEQVSSKLSACWTSLGNILGPIITRIVDLVATAIAYVTKFLSLFGFGAGGGVGTISSAGKAIANLGVGAKSASKATSELGQTGQHAYAQIDQAASTAIAQIDTLSEGVKSGGDGFTTLGDKAFAAADEVHQIGEEAKESGKKIQNLSGLDELNTWKSQSEAGGGGGGGGGAEVPDIGLPDVTLPDWAKLLADAIKNGEWGLAGDVLADAFNELVDKMLDENGWWQRTAELVGEKIAGIIKMAAEFIRKADFTGFFEGLFDGLRRAIEKIDGRDIGTLLASKFILIFSALQGALNSDIIPTVTNKIVDAINSIFVTIREKFSQAGNNGWETAGQTLGNFIMQLVQSVATLLRGIDWNEILNDIKAFWDGLKEALTSEGAKVVWSELFSSLRYAIAQIATTIDSWIPVDSQFKPFWNKLKEKLESGDDITWEEVFEALAALVTDIADYLIELLPDDLIEFFQTLWKRLKGDSDTPDWESIFDALKLVLQRLVAKLCGWLPADDETKSMWDKLKARLDKGESVSWSEIFTALFNTVKDLVTTIIDNYLPKDWSEFWSTLKNNIATALGSKDWDDLKQKIGEKLNEVFNAALQFLYDKLKVSHPHIASWLFPGQADIDKAATKFNNFMAAYGEEITGQQMTQWIEAGEITAEQAEKIAEDAGYSYANGILTSLDEVEANVDTLVGATAEEIAAYSAEYASIVESAGEEQGKIYLMSLVNAGQLSLEEAQQICITSASALASAGTEQMAATGEAEGKALTGSLAGSIRNGTLEINEATGELMSVATGAASVIQAAQGDMQTAADTATDGVPAGISGKQEAVNSAMGELASGARDEFNAEMSGFPDDVDKVYADVETKGTTHIRVLRDRVRNDFRVTRQDAVQDSSKMESSVSKSFEDMADSASDAAKNINEATVEIWGDAQKSTQASLNDMVSAVEQSFNSMQSKVDSVCGTMKQNITQAWTTIKNKINEGAKNAKSAVASNFDAIKNKVTSVNNSLKSSVTSTWNGIRTSIESSTKSAQNAATSSFTAIQTAATSAFAAVNTAISNAMSAASSSVSSAAGKMQSAISSAVSGMKSAVNTLSTIGNNAYTWGSHIANNLASGMRDNAYKVKNAASALASAVHSRLAFSEPESGPLSNFHTYMPDMIDLMVKGIKNSQSRAIHAVNGLTDEMSTAFRSAEFTMQINKVAAVGTDNALALFGDKITDSFTALLMQLQAIADSTTFRLPAIATAGITPYSVREKESAGENSYTHAGNTSEKIDRLISLLEKFTGQQQSQTVSVQVTVDPDSKGIFKMIKAEGKAERNLTGRNPFMLGS